MAVGQGQLYHCDWDMFWTSHPDASKHALLRAVSGGPVYVSDKIGETDPQVLSALTYLDGQLLLMDRPALPTEDCVFMDPMKEGVLKLSNTAGFSAVEDMWFTEKGMMSILREQGPTGFVRTRTPGRVFCNGMDVTDFVVKEEAPVSKPLCLLCAP